MSSPENCHVCFSKGKTSRLRVYQINFDEAVRFCEDDKVKICINLSFGIPFYFCSPELKVQVSYYDHFLSGVSLYVTFFLFFSFLMSSLETLSQFKPNLA